MKVLTVAGYIYSLKDKKLKKYHTGLGTIIYDLSNALSKILKLDVYCYKTFIINEILENDFRVLKNIGNFKFKELMEIIKLYRHNNIKIISSIKPKQIYYCIQRFLLLCNLAYEICGYDVVHIHSTTEFSFLTIMLCLKKNIPFIITIHNYYGKDSSVIGYDEMKTFEKKILNMDGLCITTVSSGVRKRILYDYPNILSRNEVSVVMNGTQEIQSNQKCYLNDDHRVLICPGTISNRKNQLQVIRAYDLLLDSEKNKLSIIFCGDDSLDGLLQCEIYNRGYKNKLKYIGAVDRSEMEKLYSDSDGVISASLNESFGLIFIEGYMHGLSCIFNADLDAASDIYDKKATLLVKGRSDEALSKSMSQWLRINWNKREIMDMAKKYSIDETAKKYVQIYSDKTKNISVE